MLRGGGVRVFLRTLFYIFMILEENSVPPASPFLASSFNFLISAVSLSTTLCILANTQSLLKQLALYEDPEGSTRFYVQSKKSDCEPTSFSPPGRLWGCDSSQAQRVILFAL